MTALLFRNTLAQSASVLIGYVFSFLLAPVMIARLGLDAFGLWAVTGALATYAGLLDFGIGRSLSRFIAVFDADGDDQSIRECVGLGLLAVAAVGSAATIAGFLAAPLISDQLGVLAAEDMRVVVLSSVAILTFGGVDAVLASVGIGKRQMVPPNIANTVNISLNFAFSIVALAVSSSLVVYAVANAAASFLGIVSMFIALRYVWGSPFVALPSRGLVKEILTFSVKNQIGWFADLVNLQTDKLIIAALVGVRAAAAYEIASRVVLAVRSASILTVSAIIPTAAAELVARGQGVIGDFYGRYTARSCSIAFPLFMLAFITAPFLLIAWLGQAPDDSELLVPFLSLAYLFNVTTGVGSTVAIAAGNPGLVSVNSVLIAAANVILSVILAPLLGLWGVVTATFVSLTLGSALFTARFLRRYDVPAADFFRAVLPTGALAVALAVPLSAVALFAGVPDGRPSAALFLFGLTVAYGAPYWYLASRWKMLPEKLRLPFAVRAEPARAG